MPGSLFTTPIEQITTADVNEFLQDEREEGPRLDYKVADRKKIIPEDMIEVVCAFANTYGGLLILGVADDDVTKCPILPAEGVPFGKGLDLEERITSRCFDAIVPPLAPEVRVCSFKSDPALPEDDKAFIVVRVQPSPAAPHAITRRDNRVYVRVGSECRNADLMTLRFLFERQQQREQLVEQTRAIVWRGHLSTRQLLPKSEVEPWKPGDDRIYVEFIPLDAVTDLLPFEGTFPGMDSLDLHISNKLHYLAWRGKQGNKVMQECGEPLPLQRGVGFLSRWHALQVDPVPASALYFDRSGGMALDFVERGFLLRKNQQVPPNKDDDFFFFFAAIVEMSEFLCGLLRTCGYSGRIETRAWATNVLGRTLPAIQNMDHYGEATFSLLDPKKDRSMKLGVMVNRLTRTWWKHTVKLDDFINKYSPTFVQEEPF